MSRLAHLGLFPAAFLVEPEIGFCLGFMGFVFAALSMKVIFLVPANGVLRTVIGLQAFDGGPCFDQGSVNTEVLIG